MDPVLEVAEESVWKVISARGVVVTAEPRDGAPPVGRLRGMQTVEVERSLGPWLKLKRAPGWVRAQGGSRGQFSARLRVLFVCVCVCVFVRARMCRCVRDVVVSGIQPHARTDHCPPPLPPNTRTVHAQSPIVLS